MPKQFFFVNYHKAAEPDKESVAQWKLSDALGPIARWNHGDICPLLGPHTLAHPQVKLGGIESAWNCGLLNQR